MFKKVISSVWVQLGTLVLVTALFEIANYTITNDALVFLIGDKPFLVGTWATILTFAFCAVDVVFITIWFPPNELMFSLQFAVVWAAWFTASLANAAVSSIGFYVAIHTIWPAGVPFDIMLVTLGAILLLWLLRILIFVAFVLTGRRLLPTNEHAKS